MESLFVAEFIRFLKPTRYRSLVAFDQTTSLISCIFFCFMVIINHGKKLSYKKRSAELLIFCEAEACIILEGCPGEQYFDTR